MHRILFAVLSGVFALSLFNISPGLVKASLSSTSPQASVYMYGEGGKVGNQAVRSPANLASASEIIQLVNQLRAANGLPAYRVNSALMAAAQAHSDYQAETQSTSHTGKGGSRPRDRAVAYGYGGGAMVYVSENIATGTNLSAAEAVGWWQGDSIHLNTMLSSSYRDAGAGVAEADGMVYYTLDVGYVAGEEGQPPAQQPSPGGSGATAAPGGAPAGTPVALVIPVEEATPRPDGSIVHVVQYGQALWNISAVYKVSLSYLLTLNGLSENTLIYPGDKLQIRPPKATPTSAPSSTPQYTATAAANQESATTPAPSGAGAVGSHAASPAAESRAEQTADAAELAQSNSVTAPAGALLAAQGAELQKAAIDDQSRGIDPLLAWIAGLVVVGTLLLLLGSLLRRGA